MDRVQILFEKRRKAFYFYLFFIYLVSFLFLFCYSLWFLICFPTPIVVIKFGYCKRVSTWLERSVSNVALKNSRSRVANL